MRALVWLCVLLCGARSETVPKEKDALLALGDPCERLGSHRKVAQFVSANEGTADECVPWTSDSDPCADRWSGVVCTTYAGSGVVKELHLAFSELATVPTSFQDLEHLEVANLQQNLLIGFPEALPTNALQELHLQGNRIRSIPDWLTENALHTLDLENNALTELPEWFGARGLVLTGSLRNLDLERNHLRDLPPRFCDYHSSAPWEFKLDLDANELVDVPASLAGCTRMVTLKLASNAIRSIPAFVGTMAALARLHMADNAIGTVSEGLGQLTRLVTLDLPRNRIGSVPESIGHLGALEELNLQSNRLRHLPETMSQLPRVHSLDLSDNQLTVLPSWIGRLATSLEQLNVRKNFLTSLPRELGQLTLLQVLKADENRLHGAPGSITDLQVSGSLVMLTLCKEDTGLEIQRDGRCECDTGSFGSGPDCMRCDGVEDTENVRVACPSSTTPDARHNREYLGTYLTTIYPRPGYWLNQTEVKVQLNTEHPVTQSRALILPDLECEHNAKYCIGTEVDRDWDQSGHAGRGVYLGFCQGTRLDDETNNTCMALVGAIGTDTETMGCIQPPYFCAGNHTGRFWCEALPCCSLPHGCELSTVLRACAPHSETCVEGTRKLADGSCCVPQSLHWTDFGVFVMPTFWALVIFYSSYSGNAADAILVALTFSLQTIRLVGLEKDWMHGIVRSLL